MAFVGDTVATVRVQDALDYMARHWNDANYDPGWRGPPASYQATFTAMKGFTSLGLYHEFGSPPIEWQTDFETALVDEQVEVDGMGYWKECYWGDDVLCTTWALLTLQKVAPPPAVPVDIRPTSCRNPLNVTEKGVLPVALLRWSYEDVATPYEPFLGKVDAFDCTEEGPDGYMDLSLKFKAQEVVAALGDVSDGDVLVLGLTGYMKPECDGLPFVGEDVVVMLEKGK